MTAIDVRRMIRGVTLQHLYELDVLGHERRDTIEIRNDFDLFDDVRVAGYLALRAYYLESTALSAPRDFDLRLNIPTDLRTAVEHVLDRLLHRGRGRSARPRCRR